MYVLATRSDLHSHIITQHGFRVVTYVCLGLCALTLLFRSIIRISCFRRLLPEDYLMVFSLAILVARSVVLMLALDDMYTLMDVEDGQPPGPRIIQVLLRATTTYGVVIIMDTVGVWVIKLNFLLFYYRLAHQIRSYLVFWWVVLGLTVATGIASVALLPYECLLSNDIEWLLGTCARASTIAAIYARYISCVAMDAAMDFLIISFPVLILWRSKIDLRHKVILSSIFSLVLVTVGATIVRGSMFEGDHLFSDAQSGKWRMDLSWVIFWSFIEFVASFVVACLVSFRSLWSSRGQRSKKTYPGDKKPSVLQRCSGPSHQHTIGSLGTRKTRRASRKGWTKFYDSVLDTWADLEGTIVEPEHRSNNSIALSPWRETCQEEPRKMAANNGDDDVSSKKNGISIDCGNKDNVSEARSLRIEGGDVDTLQLVKPQQAYQRASPDAQKINGY